MVVHPKSTEQRAKLAEAIKDIFIFRSLDADQVTRVLDAMLEKPVKAGEIIIKQGDEQADYFYVISSGTFDVYRDDVKENCYKDKGSFGELALMYNTPRARTIRASSDGVLWALDRVTFRRIVLKAAYEKRKYYEEVIASVPMFKCLKEYEQTNLADAFKTLVFSDGTEIIREGDGADGMYIIESGEVRVVKKAHSSSKEIARLGRGHYFGELALLTHQPRAASVYAVGETKCAVIDVSAFERLLGPCMEIMRREKESYAKNMDKIFGGNGNISDLR